MIVESTMWLQMECIDEIMFLSLFYFNFNNIHILNLKTLKYIQ